MEYRTDSSVRDREWGENYDPRSEYQTDVTVRDLVWNATLQLLEERVMFRQFWVRDRAELRDRHSRTVRRTLKTMQEMGWLTHPEDRPNYWAPGPKARERLDVAAPSQIGGNRE